LYVTIDGIHWVGCRRGIAVQILNGEVSKACTCWLSPLLLCLLLAGCASTPSERPLPKPDPAKLSTDLATLESLRQQLADLDQQFDRFRQQGGWTPRGYFDAEETRELEHLLFLFTAYHTALWDMVHSYGGVAIQQASTPDEVKVHVLAASAMLLLVNHTAHLVTAFASDEIAIEKLNEAYYRSEIPFGTYDSARDDVTNPDYLEAVRRDRALYEAAIADEASSLSQLVRSGGEFSHSVSALPQLLEEAERRLERVHELYPSHAVSVLEFSGDEFGRHQGLYFIRAVVFKDVSRLKSPTAHLIRFSDEQKAKVYELLEPGDLVLTYTAGYMSSLFIPGVFKHGITYIGTPAQREALALTPADADEAVYQREVLEEDLGTLTLENGQQADMIEAVAEGVIFNNLGHIMDTHVNRLLVLRPRLSESERRAFLVSVYSYLGDGYDFRFDFADSTQQVCTEVIYRAINGRGGIAFELIERAGHPTLSADDVVNYHLASEPQVFDVVLYAEKDPSLDDYQARLWPGREGEARLVELMEET
jgi:hypothetical protein